MIQYDQYEGRLPDDLLARLVALESLCFNGSPSDRLTLEIHEKRCLFTIVAHDADELVGFKLGYEQRRGRFYSWIGGVLPSHRGQGIATAMMQRQHQYAQDRGYRTIRTQSANQFKAMVILNLKHGFDIIGTFTSPTNHITRIVMEKQLLHNDE